MWDLWNLRSLFPEHGPNELAEILSEGEILDLRQDKLFAKPRKALSILQKPAINFLKQNTDLSSGLIISLHLGPYSLAPLPWLLSGLDVHVLVNKMSLAKIKPIYDGLNNYLPIPGKVIWVPIEGHNFAIKIVRALRQHKVVLAFLDGNDGIGGSEETLKEGLTYQLPGRKIKVRTGLARIAARCGAPIHSVVTIWPPTGTFKWERGPTWAINSSSSPDKTTETLYDWAFDVVINHAPQWKCWNMLTGVYESFAPETVISGNDPITDSTTVKWTGKGLLWPGDMLEDLEGHCFFAAEGLTHINIKFLQQKTGCSVASLNREYGPDWISIHLPRLAALGFISVK